MLFLCCHPALTPASAIALTLRAVGGLTTAEIARAFLVAGGDDGPADQPGQADDPRLRRGRSGCRRRTSGTTRLRSVLHVLYLIFNEGYAEQRRRPAAAHRPLPEAIRLARLVHRMLPDDAEAAGLLALMLLLDARRPARTDARASSSRCPSRTARRWDRALIAEGPRCSTPRWRAGAVGEYQLQAAIAAVHDRAPRAEDTDWPQILALYGLLERMTGNPVVTLNRAVAAAMVDGPEAGLALLDEVERPAGRLAPARRRAGPPARDGRRHRRGRGRAYAPPPPAPPTAPNATTWPGRSPASARPTPGESTPAPARRLSPADSTAGPAGGTAGPEQTPGPAGANGSRPPRQGAQEPARHAGRPRRPRVDPAAGQCEHPAPTTRLVARMMPLPTTPPRFTSSAILWRCRSCAARGGGVRGSPAPPLRVARAGEPSAPQLPDTLRARVGRRCTVAATTRAGGQTSSGVDLVSRGRLRCRADEHPEHGGEEAGSAESHPPRTGPGAARSPHRALQGGRQNISRGPSSRPARSPAPTGPAPCRAARRSDGRRPDEDRVGGNGGHACPRSGRGPGACPWQGGGTVRCGRQRH